MRQSQSKAVRLVSYLMESPRKLLTTILIGNMFVNIAASSLADGLTQTLFPGGGTWIAVIVMTFLILIFGEITPKTIAVQNSEKITLFSSEKLYYFQRFLSPFQRVIQFFADAIIQTITGEPPSYKHKLTPTELKTVVDIGFQEGVVDVFEKRIIENVFKFGDRTIKQIYTPRHQVEMLEISADVREAREFIEKVGFSRIPAYKNEEENIVGFIYARDLILEKSPDKTLHDFIQKVRFVPETKKVGQLLIEFQKEHHHFAIVIDEYGVFSGIITIDDLLEEVVGEITDIKSREKKFYRILPSGEIILLATMELVDFNRQFGTRLYDNTVQSVGGYIMNHLGRIPQQGEKFKIYNLWFEVIQAKPNKIEKLKFWKAKKK
jgi:putative hemolysin